jgi:hypothetical protein
LVPKKRSEKLLIIGLVAVTVVWFIALCLHIQDYNRYIQGEVEHFIVLFDTDEAGAREFMRGYWDGLPIYAWRFGLALVISAFIILLAWVRVIILAFRYILRSLKRNNV